MLLLLNILAVRLWEISQLQTDVFARESGLLGMFTWACTRPVVNSTVQ